MKRKLLFSCLFAILLSFGNVGVNTIKAHNFSTDDNSTFLTFINMILIENRLINNSIINISTNETFHFDYIKNINEIVDDILVSEDSLLVDSDQFYNNTIIATMMANLADEVLRKYGYGFGIPSNVMLNMNFSAANTLVTESRGDGGGENIDHTAHGSTILENHSIIPTLTDKSQYYGALETSKRMMEIYESDLESGDKIMPGNDTVPILKKSLAELNENIANYSSPVKIMEIVHGKVHPQLQIAFNLTLKR